MAKTKIDFKKLLLEKGERIGVGVAGVLALLLIVLSLLLPGKGLLSGSPAEKAKGLNQSAEFIKAKLADPNNKPTDADKPDPKGAETGLVALETKPIDGDKYRLEPLIPAVGSTTLGRRVPQVFGVDEAVVKLARMQIQTYILDESTPPKIYALKVDKESGGDKPGASGAPSAGGRFKGMQGMLGRGGMGGMGMAGRGRGNLRRPGMFKTDAEDAKLDKEQILIPLDEIDKHPNLTLAEQVRPLRMAIIAASFPYKKQLEEFRAKLGLRSLGDVYAENSTETFKGHPLRSFRFLEVQVQRRELDGDGNPLRKDDPDGGYKTLPLKETYGPYVVMTGGRFEEDDPELIPVRIRGLVMPRLKQFNPEKQAKSGAGGMAPPGIAPPVMKGPEGAGREKGAKIDPTKDHYPPVEKELPTLNKTLESLRGKTALPVTATPDRFRGIDDVFNPGTDSVSGSPDGTGATGRPDGTDGGKPIDPKDDPSAVQEFPDHCLVRAIDVTIEPGKFYEYRLRIVMANPNVGRADVAAPNYARDKELAPSDWSKTPLRIHVDSELHYYAVDQKKLEKGYTGPNHSARIDEEKQVWLQAHRWLETINLPSLVLFIGEWTAAERFAAYRGEYAGRPLPTQVPCWRYLREDFVIADDGANRRRGSKPQMLIDFGFNAGGAQPEAIVVDFHNGKLAIDKVTSRTDDGKAATTARVADEAGEEVLLLDPNGRLKLLEGATDANDPKRKERLKQVRKRITEVEQSGKKGGGGASDKPFGS